jgi:hypothetical protein
MNFGMRNAPEIADRFSSALVWDAQKHGVQKCKAAVDDFSVVRENTTWRSGGTAVTALLGLFGWHTASTAPVIAFKEPSYVGVRARLGGGESPSTPVITGILEQAVNGCV